MNGDSLELMQRLGESDTDLKEDSGGLRAENAGFRGNANDRKSAIEEDMKDQKFWGNVKASSGPVMVMLHIAAHKLGLKL